MNRAPGLGSGTLSCRRQAVGRDSAGARVNHTSVTFKGYTMPFFFFNISNLFFWKNTPRPIAGAQEALP